MSAVLAGTVNGDRVTLTELDQRDRDNYWRVEMAESKMRKSDRRVDALAPVWGPKYVRSLIAQGLVK